MSTDRLSDGYQPNFDIDLAAGKQGELFVANIASSLGSSTVEVKTDEQATRTGNIYVEYECKGRPSGIATTQAATWAYVLGHQRVLVAMDTALLKAVAREQMLDVTKRLACIRGSHPTKGVVVPLSELLPMALRIASSNSTHT